MGGSGGPIPIPTFLMAAVHQSDCLAEVSEMRGWRDSYTTDVEEMASLQGEMCTL